MNRKTDRELTRANHRSGSPESAGAHGNDSADVMAAVWRYRWAVILPMIAGMAIGLLFYLQSEETYRSTTRLMVESDRPAMFDNMSGDMYGGVPAIEIVESQLFSDEVMRMAFESPGLQPFRERFGNNTDTFIGIAQQSLVLEPEVEDLRTAQSLVTLLHFDSTDREISEAAVKAFSESLQKYFNQRQKSSRKDLMNLITEATERVYPELTTLETQYSEFRRNAPLAWDANGKAINPHRERQLFLIQRRSELIQKKRQSETELKSVESIIKRSTKDPLLALNIIGQLLEKNFVLPDNAELDVRQGDNQLAQIELDQELVPLMIERNKYEAEFGPNHPTVKVLDAELATMKGELKRLVEKETTRIVELMSAGKSEQLTKGSCGAGCQCNHFRR